MRAGADVDAYRAIVVGYAALGLLIGLTAVVRRRRDRAATARRCGRRRDRGAGSASAGRRGSSPGCRRLFALDAFAGGFVPQSLMAYWFHLQFGVPPAALGAHLLRARTSSPRCRRSSAARIAARIGLINTMVFTHLPSNVLLILVPLMPTLPLAVVCPARALRPEPDGRPDAPVVRDGGRRARRAVGCGRRDRHRPHDRRGDLAVDLGRRSSRARRSRRCRSSSPAA